MYCGDTSGQCDVILASHSTSMARAERESSLWTTPSGPFDGGGAKSTAQDDEVRARPGATLTQRAV